MATKKRLKLKKEAKIFILISIVLICLLIFIIKFAIKKYDEYKYKQTTEYKLLEKGYEKEVVTTFLNKLDNERINYILDKDKNDIYYNLIIEKYYLDKNFDRYYNYKEEHPDKSYKDTIAIVNVNADNKWYSNSIKSDLSKNNLILSNKFNELEESYVPEDIVNIGLSYSYEGNSCREETYEAFKEMYKAAKEEDLSLIITSSYRSYIDQKDTYEYYESYYGKDKTDSIAARPGYSEHQTGLALDIFSPTSGMKTFKDTNEYTWLINNSYKYGFILRYPEGKEYLTGFGYEAWHYRYVGKDIATKIHNEDITYDEYYAYYLDK